MPRGARRAGESAPARDRHRVAVRNGSAESVVEMLKFVRPSISAKTATTAPPPTVSPDQRQDVLPDAENHVEDEEARMSVFTE